MMRPKINPKDYYDFLPPNQHRTGDIWSKLPIFAMKHRRVTRALVITPACDLANAKCETITYIPIVTISEFMSSPPFYADVWAEIFSSLQKLKIDQLVRKPSRFELPNADELEAAIEIARRDAKAAQAPLIGRIERYVKYVRAAQSGDARAAAEIGNIFSQEKLGQIRRKIVTNSYRGDIHFLPADGKVRAVAAIEEHSVALFRHPQSLPSHLLDAAQTATENSWAETTAALEDMFPAASVSGRPPGSAGEAAAV